MLAPGEMLSFRCSDIGKFRLDGDREEAATATAALHILKIKLINCLGCPVLSSLPDLGHTLEYRLRGKNVSD